MIDAPDLTFELQPRLPHRETDRWSVVSEATTMGEVRWAASLGRYTFRPGTCTMYESGALRELAKFCAKQTQMRKAR